MNKNRIRLTESQLHKVIKQSVRQVLNEGQSHPIFETDKVLNIVEELDNLWGRVDGKVSEWPTALSDIQSYYYDALKYISTANNNLRMYIKLIESLNGRY